MLNNKVVVITGLIGKEFVKAVVENGGIADINEEIGLKVKGNLNIDITSKNSLNECIQYLDKKLMPILEIKTFFPC